MARVASFLNCFAAVTLLCALGLAHPSSVSADAQCAGGPDEQLGGLAVELFGDNQNGAGSGTCLGGDVNGDGAITVADLIADMSALLILPTPTPTPAVGPVIIAFDLAAADGTTSVPSAVTSNIPIYQRQAGSGFLLVLEAIPGSDGASVGTMVFNSKATDPTAQPDIQIEASRSLGDGDAGVCTAGGIPSIDPPDFTATQTVSNALNDFSCAFEANANPARACTVDAFGSPSFISSGPRVVQFCLVINADKVFPSGDTTLTARLRDTAGAAGPESAIVIRIGNQPVATATTSPTNTQIFTVTPTRTATRVNTITPTWTVPPRSTASPTLSATVVPATATPTPTITATPTTPSLTPSSTPTRSATAVPTQTPTATAVPSVTPTPTRTFTFSPTPTGTRLPSASPTQTRTAVPTSTPPVSATQAPTSTASRSPTAMSSPTPTASFGSATATVSPTLSPTTFVRSATPTSTRSPIQLPTLTASPTITFTGTITVVPRTSTPTPTRITPSATPTSTTPPSPSASPTWTSISASRTPSASATKTMTKTASPTATPTITGTRPNTPTPTLSATATVTATATQTPLPSRTPSPTWTVRFTPTPTNSPSPTQTVPPSPSLSPIPSVTVTSSPSMTATRPPTATASITRTWTFTPTRTASATRPPTASPTVTVSPSPTRTPTITSSPTLTRTPTRTATPTLTPTVTLTPTSTRTPTLTLTPTVTSTPSPTIPPEPVITFFGIARADDTVPTPIATATDGTPIFKRDASANCAGELCAYDFSLVIEARPGGTLAPVGSSTFNWNPSNPSSLPDLQVEASNNLGNGSTDVCDDSGPTAGGVPAVSPFDFSSNSAGAINDLSCRFQDGTGAPLGRSALDPCTKFGPAEVFQFKYPKVSTIQFCALIDKPIAFPVGDTMIAARVRDTAGNLSAVSSIIIRVTSP